MASPMEWDEIRKHERSGRPLGEESFVERLEEVLDRKLKRKKPGPKPLSQNNIVIRNASTAIPLKGGLNRVRSRRGMAGIV